ncbi:thymidine phosphorylase, partial [Tsukamurella tyrosinosolvens]
TWHATVGDTVTAGEPLFTLHTDTPEKFDGAVAALDGAAVIGGSASPRGSLVLDRVTV